MATKNNTPKGTRATKKIEAAIAILTGTEVGLTEYGRSIQPRILRKLE
jgi:hypothetical protein